MKSAWKLMFCFYFFSIDSISLFLSKEPIVNIFFWTKINMKNCIHWNIYMLLPLQEAIWLDCKRIRNNSIKAYYLFNHYLGKTWKKMCVSIDSVCHDEFIHVWWSNFSTIVKQPHRREIFSWQDHVNRKEIPKMCVHCVFSLFLINVCILSQYSAVWFIRHCSNVKFISLFGKFVTSLKLIFILTPPKWHIFTFSCAQSQSKDHNSRISLKFELDLSFMVFF